MDVKVDLIGPAKSDVGPLPVKSLVAALNSVENRKTCDDAVARILDSSSGQERGRNKIATRSLVLAKSDQHVTQDPANQQREPAPDPAELSDGQLRGNNSDKIINPGISTAKREQTISVAETDTFKGDLLGANASSKQLKSGPPANLCPDRQDLFDGVLDINTVASLLPKDRTSTEESAIEHIITLESEQLRHRHHSVPNEDGNGFTSEQDSGIFDLSLVQQDDFEILDSREASREWPLRSITPEQRRKHLQRSVSDSSKCLRSAETRRRPKESCQCQKVKRNLRIPSCFLSNPSLFLESEVSASPNTKLPLKSPAINAVTGQAAGTLYESCAEDITERTETSSASFPESGTQNPISPDESECQTPCSSETSSDSEPESSEGLQAYQGDAMGKKTQSLSRGRQPHVVYSKEEFSEEYATPKRSKSWDKRKQGKKGGEKDKPKPKDRKRILSEPSQGMDTKVVISPPLTASQEEILRNKRHTIGRFPMSTPTQEAGTDTSELLDDAESPTACQEQRQFAPTPNESNNNQELHHKSKKRLAQSRSGGLSPEAIPAATRYPLRKQQSLPNTPEVVVDTLSKSSASCDGPAPPKPKRLSLTNQLQRPSDKPLDGPLHLDGSQLPPARKDHVYERKTEIAVERQVLLKQAAKTNPVDQQSKFNDTSVSPLTQATTSDAPGPFPVFTRFGDDGEEELILGALPLPETQEENPPGGRPPTTSVARKPEKPIPAKRKIRHYACIEPVGKPVQGFKTEEPKQECTPSEPSPPSPREEPKPDSNRIPFPEESPPVAKSSTVDQEVKPPLQQAPPVVITCPAPDTSLKVPEVIPDALSSSVPPKTPSSPGGPEDLHRSPTTGSTPMTAPPDRSRLASSSDTASTASIPPSSPPELDYQELLAQAAPSERSLPSSSEPSLSIDFARLDPAAAQQMVTVSSAMMPEIQTVEVTVIDEDCPVVNSTEEVGRGEAAEVQQAVSPDAEKEPATGSPPASQPAASQPDVPSISCKVEEETEAEVDNEEDEDSGVYDASYRHSDWIYVGDNQELQMMTKQVDYQPGMTGPLQTVAEVNKSADVDDVPQFDRADEARESVTTTTSESAFRTQYQSLAYRRVHRKTSAIDYQRLSLIARERKVTVRKVNKMFGFRIQYSRPVVVTDVDKGGAAEQGGLRVGDMILRVNGHDVRQAPHSQVVRLAMNGPDTLDLVVGTNVCNTLNLYAEKPVMCGYLHKLGGAGMIRTWKKRWFVLKYDNCLYYYKTEDDVEPLGAIVLCNYTVMKARDVGKSYAFKLTKCKARTYYFYTATEEEMSRWAKSITEAAKPQNTSDIWLDISTHNVGLPALSVRNPDCHGFLHKLGAIRKTWKRRFCVLKDACLYYYKDIDAQHALGVAHFHGYSIQETEIGSKKFGLVLKHPSQELRVFYFVADHETDRKRWVAAFAKSIGRWIQTNNGEESDEDSAEMLI